MLLHDTSLRALCIADLLGVKALVVDLVDESAEAFFVRYGFECIPRFEGMFVPLLRPSKWL